MFGLTDAQLDLYNTSIEILLTEGYIPRLISKTFMMIQKDTDPAEADEEYSMLVEDIANSTIFEGIHASYWYLGERCQHGKKPDACNEELVDRLYDRIYNSLISVGVAARGADVLSMAINLAKEIIQTYIVVVDQSESFSFSDFLNKIFGKGNSNENEGRS